MYDRRRWPIPATLALSISAAQGAEPAALSGPDLTQLSLERLLDTPVYTASRFSQKSSNAPSSVTVVTAADIKTYSYIGVRGFSPPGDYNTRLLVMVDGYRVNDPVFDNLFDHKYADPVAFDVGVPTRDVIQQDGHNFRVKLSYRF